MFVSWIDKDTGATQVVQFDVVTKESIETSLQVTSHPVEDGSDVTDNAHPEPIKISIEAYMSNTPLPSNPGVFGNINGPIVSESSLSLEAKKLDLAKMGELPQFGEQGPTFLELASQFTPGAGTKIVTGAISNFFNPAPDSATTFRAVPGFVDRVQKVYFLLANAQFARTLVTVHIKLLDMEDMLISKLGVPRATQDGDGASFSIDFQRVRIVKSATVDAPIPAESRAAPTKSAGAQPTSDSKKDNKNQVGWAKALKDKIAGGPKIPRL